MSNTPKNWTRFLIPLFKYGISFAILYYVIYQVQTEDAQVFESLRDQPKNWSLLGCAWGCVLLAVMTTFVRWWFLVKAIDLPFRLKDAMRLGFLGYLFNFVSLGSVGGDLFKAVFIAREHPGRRTDAIATVVIDRMVGLYALFIVAALAILTADIPMLKEDATLKKLSDVILLLTAIGAVAIFMLLIPGFTGGKVSSALSKVPFVGSILVQLITAIRIYREKLPLVFLTLLMSVVVHSLFTVSFYLIATSLPETSPSFKEHFLIVPMGLLAGAIPLPMGGLGAFELVLEKLYLQIGGSTLISEGKGLIVALAYRVITILVAAVGVIYWLSARKEVERIIHDVEEESID